ncbi:GNAT family N-acetyltransferase [Serratia symbiotica]|uniref:GNAT family N-acetyltransferase n=1 Tax=Serratia symbiotica TaxID=138074 RepID=A0A7D5NMJ4_9GAMM|nr:GNAT family N-acetyltransferase [Serratia symbiotica]MBQ0955072.1 GNAT family N-acetyltransferase [Serratia symbiotica]QLH63042.1 GNAT family N-acetyltransferase [Serratia symbiotica]QTP15295.1 GNAT family N-acetyltransferase [Serratia symbiotica]
MLKKLINPAFLGWSLGTALDYEMCHHMYGGSFITHPDVLAFIHARFDCSPSVHIKRDSNGALLGAFCAWKKAHLAGDIAITQKLGIERYPFNKDEIILPFNQKLRGILPFRTKLISSLNRANIFNSTFKLNSDRAVCIAKGCGNNGFSSKTKNSRNRELNKFLAAGGEIVEQSIFSPDELTTIYFDLFESRWGHRPDNYLETVDMLTSLRSFFFGHVLFLAGKPCAFQFITKADSPTWINFDYVNGGYDKTHHSFCPGTIVTWVNIKSAYELCNSTGKTMRYSFGRPTAAYKDRWCRKEPLGRILSL